MSSPFSASAVTGELDSKTNFLSSSRGFPVMGIVRGLRVDADSGWYGRGGLSCWMFEMSLSALCDSNAETLRDSVAGLVEISGSSDSSTAELDLPKKVVMLPCPAGRFFVACLLTPTFPIVFSDVCTPIL